MKPKDLKNSEELKSTMPNGPDQQQDAGATEEVEKKSEEKIDEVVSQAEDSVEKESPQSDEPIEEKIESEEVVSEKEVVEETETEVVNTESVEQNDESDSVVEEEVNAETEVKEEALLKEDEKKEEVKADTEEKPEKEEKEEGQEPVIEAKESTSVEVKEEVPGKEEKVSTSKEESVEKDKAINEEKEVEDIAEDKKEKKEEVKKATEAAPEKKVEKKEADYSKYSQVELINALRELLEHDIEYDVKNEVENIKIHFYKLNKLQQEEDKKKFIEEGGDPESYVVEDNPYEQDIRDLLKRFRQLRIEFNRKQESQKEDNLKEKYEVIEEIKNLINNEESINKTFQEFRELQIRWHEIGLVPQSKMKDLWDTYHFHVENFYDYIKINKELRDLDLRKNLEMKIDLCEKAEELLVESSVIKAFNILQKHHEQWREIGPVPRDKKDEIWERFKAATSKINKKHQEFFEKRKLEQKKNLEAKTALCEKAEEISEEIYVNYKDWDEKSKKLIELQKVWRTIGFAPKRDNNQIYERFRIACDKFFDNKREFYSKNKELQQNNLQLKIDLCNQAESLKDSTDWKKTTQDFINIQKKWKEIGPVPRKHSDIIWKRFRTACDYFFNKKSKHFSGIDGEQVDNLKLKEELIKEVEEFNPTDDIDKDLKVLKDFQRRWTEIGHVPIRQKDDVQNKFREAINKHFDTLELDDSRKNILKFRSKVSNFSETSRGQNKMRLEREKYMTKLKQLENDLVLLDNNIGFFAQSKNAESLIADVNHKIEQTREKIEFLKNKIRIIDEYDKFEE